MSFIWNPNEQAPCIEPHSRAKLDVLRQYLAEYIDTLSSHHGRAEFKLDLVDGFAGGGLYRSGTELISGSPLVMIEEVLSAQDRVNSRRKKPIQFDVKYYFIDSEQSHIDYLKRVFEERGYDLRKNNISMFVGRFEDHFDSIVAEIKRRQPKSGRSIFLLDQTGYSHVNLLLVKRILDELSASEVILTVAMDALRNYAHQSDRFRKAVAPLHLTSEQIQKILEGKNLISDGMCQRLFRSHLRSVTMASYDTPFYIKPSHSRRALWFVHLSKHPKARDVMIQTHWNQKNIFRHVGSGGFGMLGWDELSKPEEHILFDFDAEALERLKNELLNEIPSKLHGLISHGPVSVAEIYAIWANETAAKFSDLNWVLTELVREGEFELLTSDGKPKGNRSSRILKPNYQIAIASNPLLPIFTRRHKFS